MYRELILQFNIPDINLVESGLLVESRLLVESGLF